MEGYKYKSLRKVTGELLLSFETLSFKDKTAINPKAIATIQNIPSAGFDEVLCDGKQLSTDCRWNIATLWDGRSFVIDMIDAYDVRWKLWRERCD